MKKNLLTALALGSLAVFGASAQTPRGVDRANLDPGTPAGQDFYQYACGGWMKSHPLTAEYSRYGTFDLLRELNRTQVRDLVLGLDPAKELPGSNGRKVADLYALGMDSVRLNADGAAPVAADLAKIYSTSRKDLFWLLATLPGGALVVSGVQPDMLNVDRNVMYVTVGGLGLGDRDYYIEGSEATNKVMKAYREYLFTLAKLAGMTDKQAYDLAGNTVMVETSLAEAYMTREERRDPAAGYNPATVSQLSKDIPQIDFTQYFSALGLPAMDTVIVEQPRALKAVNMILANYPEKMVQDYVAACYLQAAAPYLSDDFAQAQFELDKVMSGVEQMQPRWKRALGVPNSLLGEAVGQLYVAKYFPPVAKEKMTTLVANLQTALGQHITNLPWMSDETKARALEKLAKFIVKIGYPDKWQDYTALTVDPSLSYWENIKAAYKFNNDINLADYGKPVDKSRWYMTPQTVNAYYNPTTNEICFPAGILQAPYFNPDADDAENYGAIGVVIGHEMTHGFDDQGRQFDKDGNFSNWWTAADEEAFNKLADGLVAQFDAIEVAPGVNANGRFTLGENIADQGGLRVAYTAYHNALGGGGEAIDGFTPDQRFYLSYANVWAGNIREAEILKRTKTDPHSLGRLRVNASLRNIEPFFRAFGITEGDSMYRPEAERVVIW